MQKSKLAIAALVASLALVAAPRAQAQARYEFPAYTSELVGQADPPPTLPLCLWYRQPAKEWVEALPIGNGRLGAMVFGGIEEEHLQLNENTLWGGGPYNPANPEALEAIKQVRELVFAGKIDEAQKLCDAKGMAVPKRELPYQPVGSLVLKFPKAPKVENYRRELNLTNAVADVSYTIDGVTYRREVFASHPDNIIVMRFWADQPGKINFDATLTTPQKAECTVVEPASKTFHQVGNLPPVTGQTLALRGTGGDAQGIAGAAKFDARVRVFAEGGKVSKVGDDAVRVAGSDAAMLIITAATSFNRYNDVSGNAEQRALKPLDDATAPVSKLGIPSAYSILVAGHDVDYHKLFNPVALDLGGEDADAAKLPTDERLRNFAKGDDPSLATLYFQFGRYLLIACSRPGGQPANLQGLWNWQMKPPWESNYTININTQMNYWPAEIVGLGECAEPLFTMVDELAESGQRTAKTMYGARGWVAHHNSDLWRNTAPVDGYGSGMWPTGGAWLCTHLWEHYLFTQDREFLAKHYPAMKGACEFFLDQLVEDPRSHYLVTCPSESPENRYQKGLALCAGPTMDNQIITDLFNQTIEAAKILGVDADLQAKLAATRDRLPPNKIGAAGQLQEWQDDIDMQVPEIHHRHVSHLYGLYPSAQITLRGTPDLAAAVKKSLEIRGDEATGWGTGWRINLWTRLQDGDHAYGILAKLLTLASTQGKGGLTYVNMFDAHPPFQIDGNFGGAAGIAEMLLQSHAGEIELLPALPKAWPTGSVRGLRARGGFEVAMDWKDGKVTKARIHSLSGKECTVRFNGKTQKVSLQPGGDAVIEGAPGA